MPHSTALTEEEKQNGKRKLLIPSKEIQEQMPGAPRMTAPSSCVG
jgi:hypothetical protein